MQVRPFSHDNKGQDVGGKWHGVGISSPRGTKRGTFTDYKKPKASRSLITPFRKMN